MDSGKLDNAKILEGIKRGYEIRGEIINNTILVERVADGFISVYFLGKSAKRLELMELIICDRMDLSLKFDAVISILKKRCKNKSIDFKKSFPKIAEDFQIICKDRNKFAHNLMFPNAWNFTNNTVISLIKFRDVAEIVNYSDEKYKQILKRLEHYKELLEKITDEILDEGEIPTP